MKARVIIFSLLIGFPLWGMEMIEKSSKKEVNKNWFIEALNYRQNSKDPIVLCFQDVRDDESETALLKTARKSIQAMPKKPDIKAMINPLSYLSGRVVNDQAKKVHADEINNSWIALCLGVSYSNDGELNVQKYNVSSRIWEFGKQVHCKLPEGHEYKDLQASDMVVVNIPYSDSCDAISCFTLIRSLCAKSIPLLVHSDQRLLQDMWANLGDLFPEKEDAKVFSNYQRNYDYSDDAAETSSGQQSKSEDIFAYVADDSAYDGDDSNNAEEDIFDQGEEY